MSESELWDAPVIVPSLAYEDVPKAIEWLTQAFGFKERSRGIDLEGHRWEFSQQGKEVAAKYWKLPPGLKRNKQ